MQSLVVSALYSPAWAACRRWFCTETDPGDSPGESSSWSGSDTPRSSVHLRKWPVRSRSEVLHINLDLFTLFPFEGSNWLKPSVAKPSPWMTIVPPPSPIVLGSIEVTLAPSAGPEEWSKRPARSSLFIVPALSWEVSRLDSQIRVRGSWWAET